MTGESEYRPNFVENHPTTAEKIIGGLGSALFAVGLSAGGEGYLVAVVGASIVTLGAVRIHARDQAAELHNMLKMLKTGFYAAPQQEDNNK